METITARAIHVERPDQTGEARRAVIALASEMRLDDDTAGRAALVVTECANNLWRHGGGGEIVVSAALEDATLEILALDKGPGIMNLNLSFSDGYSTGGSAGQGLGAIRRMASEVDVFTGSGKGFALLARIRHHSTVKKQAPRLRFEAGAVSVPKPGELANGDGVCFRQQGNRALILVVDGLGHGPAAAECASAAAEVFQDSRLDDPVELLGEVHGALRPTRGAAAAVARIDPVARRLSFAGVGNIMGIVAGSRETRHISSQPGIAGHKSPTVRELTFEWSPGALLILYSDGISGHWSLESYNGLVSRHPSLIAGVLYRDWRRGTDDATVLVAREK